MIDGDWGEFVPVRLPVDWEFRGEPGLHPEIEELEGKSYCCQEKIHKI